MNPAATGVSPAIDSTCFTNSKNDRVPSAEGVPWPSMRIPRLFMILAVRTNTRISWNNFSIGMFLLKLRDAFRRNFGIGEHDRF